MTFLLHTGTSALIIYISNIQRTDVDFIDFRNRVAAKILPQIPGGLKKLEVFGVPLVCLVHPSKDTLLCQRRAKSPIATPFVRVSITSDTLQAVKKLAPLQRLVGLF